MTELCMATAAELAQKIRTREVSCVEVMQAHIAQVERLNPILNAICTFLPEQALEGARAADAAVARGDDLGPLHGLPTAIKDTVPTAGIRTTYGSPIFADHVPTEDALVVERMKAAGAVIMGKTNVPEFGAGAHTFNPVFGPSRNAYDTSRTVGGSSGGAALGLAARMFSIANGSDTGGSLRIPGNFNNVVGLRPSPGRVPYYPNGMGWYTMGVPGPMARTVEDTGLLLSAMAGADARSPIGIHQDGAIFRQALERDFNGVRIAWSRDLGRFPVDPAVTSVLEANRHVFSDLGCIVEEAHPDFEDAEEIFRTLRAWNMAGAFAEHYATRRDQLKASIVWNIEEGLTITGADLYRTEVQRTKLYHRVRAFLEDYEYLILPVNQVPPFALDQEYPAEVAGQPMSNYIEWMQSCYFITVTGLPACSVPCGFTEDGLPVGVQIVGRNQSDLSVLQLAHAFEQATETWRRVPSMAQ
jgi:amidase